MLPRLTVQQFVQQKLKAMQCQAQVCILEFSGLDVETQKE